MNLKKIIGGILISVPFIMIFIGACVSHGFLLVSVGVFIFIVLLSCVYYGVILISD